MICDSPSKGLKFSSSETRVLRELSSFDFGFVKFNSPKGNIKKQVLEKAINCLDSTLSSLVEKFKDKQEKEKAERKEEGLLSEDTELDLFDKYTALLERALDPYIYLYLGHYQLLLYLYEDALSAYLEFETRCVDCWCFIPFLYGLGICYFHFNAFDKAIEIFQKIIYLQPSCSRSKEVHIRLGYIYKLNTNFECSLKHFRQALNDSTKGSFTETEIRFQIAHLLEVCGKYKQAQKAYEQLIGFSKEDAPDHIKHLCYRQLGWLHFAGYIGKSNPNTPTKKESVIQLLHQAITLDDTSGKTWYLFGRAQAKENKVQEAFMAYRNSIDKTEANADTWCSIGVLYQEQNQPMDALQAYFCACQLDRKHVAAWTNLGVLYESMVQHKEALKCYQNAVNADKNNEVRPEIKERMVLIQKLLSQMPEKTPTTNQVNSSQQKMSQIRSPHHQNINAVSGGVNGPLPTVDEAWNLPIPTELTQRQMQLEMQEAVASASNAGSASRIYAHHSPSYMSNNLGTTTDIALDPNGSKRRRITDSEDQVAPLSQQQAQLLLSLESQSGQLSVQQRQTLSLLQNQLHRYQVQQHQSKQISNNLQSPTTIGNINSMEHSLDKKEARTSVSSVGQEQVGSNQDNNSAHTEDLHLIRDLDEISEDYGDDIMVNLDALLNDPMGNFDEHMDEGNIEPGSNNNQLDSMEKHMKEDMEYPVTDLLSYLRLVNDEKSSLINRLDDFDVAMSGSQIIDKVTKINDNNLNLWNVTFLPGNRIPSVPQPPPLIPITSSSADRNVDNNNVTNNNSMSSRHTAEYFQLLPPTPSVYLDCKKDVHSSELRQFCLSQPVVVIRNLASTLRLDLGLFSTKMLVDSNPTHKIDQRVQEVQPPDENKDPSGKTLLRCFSSRSITTIQDYANYQARTFVEARKEEKSGANGPLPSILSNAMGNQTLLNNQLEEIKISNVNPNEDKKKKRKIFFGTNCDLSDETKWFTQLHELNKLPTFLKVVSACNMLSHCGFTIMGMNSVQLYMKVPGCRTPGHQENNNFCSVNINVGPGDCEWFSVPDQYWGAINLLCEENKVDYLSGSWWPSLDDLKLRQIPVYRFIQRPGDLVWINAGTIHWVQAIGWCNNVAWNVGPFISRQYSLAMERYEYNKLRMYKSIVPMIHLSWQLARNVKMTDSHLFQLIKYTLMISLIQCCLTWNFLEKARVSLVYQPREENEATQSCEDCECEVFNIFLIKQIKGNVVTKKSTKDVKYETRCLNCALKMNSNLTSFKAMYQYKLAELIEVYDNFRFQSSPIAAYSVNR